MQYYYFQKQITLAQFRSVKTIKIFSFSEEKKSSTVLSLVLSVGTKCISIVIYEDMRNTQ